MDYALIMALHQMRGVIPYDLVLVFTFHVRFVYYPHEEMRRGLVEYCLDWGRDKLST